MEPPEGRVKRRRGPVGGRVWRVRTARRGLPRDDWAGIASRGGARLAALVDVGSHGPAADRAADKGAALLGAAIPPEHAGKLAVVRTRNVNVLKRGEVGIMVMSPADTDTGPLYRAVLRAVLGAVIREGGRRVHVEHAADDRITPAVLAEIRG